MIPCLMSFFINNTLLGYIFFIIVRLMYTTAISVRLCVCAMNHQVTILLTIEALPLFACRFIQSIPMKFRSYCQAFINCSICLGSRSSFYHKRGFLLFCSWNRQPFYPLNIQIWYRDNVFCSNLLYYYLFLFHVYGINAHSMHNNFKYFGNNAGLFSQNLNPTFLLYQLFRFHFISSVYYNISAFKLLDCANIGVTNIFDLQMVVDILYYIFWRLCIKRLSAIFIIKFYNNFICFIKSRVRDGVPAKETPVVTFLTAFCKAILAYDGLEVVVEFFIVIICSSINVLRCVDMLAAFRILSKMLQLLSPCLVFSMNTYEAWKRFLKLLAGSLCLFQISLSVLSMYNPNI